MVDTKRGEVRRKDFPLATARQHALVKITETTYLDRVLIDCLPHNFDNHVLFNSFHVKCNVGQRNRTPVTAPKRVVALEFAHKACQAIIEGSLPQKRRV